jgi:hypothetical protein
MFEPADLTVADLPSVSLERRCELPSCQGIYFVTASDGAVLYIGKSNNIFARWRGHHRLADLSSWEHVSISWLQFSGDAALLSEIERACIEYFSPLLNGSLRRGVSRHLSRIVPDDEFVERLVRMPGWVYNLMAARATAQQRTTKYQIAHELEWLARRIKEEGIKDNEPGPRRRTALEGARS